ncbi:hypothetical protein HDU81_002540 [Chytriomyces hyalinus]|nr:hypothetical protein HDU81_002540 [Chytriomyces hyalinus]
MKFRRLSTSTGSGITTPFMDISQHFHPVTPLVHAHGRVLVLNNPKMDADMMASVAKHVEEWDKDKNVHVITLVKRSNVPVFCGGLNVPFEADWEQALEQATLLAHQIASLNTPFVSIMDGPTHGLGASLSLHAPFRIATDTSSISFREGPCGILGLGVPGTAFAMKHLLLDPYSKDMALGKYLALTGTVLNGLEAVLAGIATTKVPSDRISPLVKRLCESKSSDLRILDMAIEEFGASSPSVEDWSNWRLGGEVSEAIHRCFKQESLHDIVAALRAENTEWSKATLQEIEKQSPTVLDLSIESFNLVQPPTTDLLTSFKTDLNILRNVEAIPDFTASVKQESERSSASPGLPAQFALDPALVNRDSWLGSELDEANAAIELPVWKPDLKSHLALTSNARSRKSWLTKGKYLVKPFVEEEVDPTKQAIDGETSIWINRTFSAYPHRVVTSLPQVRDVQIVIKGEAAGSGDVAMTRSEALSYFTSNWNNFLDEQRFLHPISASPVENWRLEDTDGISLRSETPSNVPFYPSKFYDVSRVDDPFTTGEEGKDRYSIRRKDIWGLRQRIEHILDFYTEVVNGLYLSWKEPKK